MTNDEEFRKGYKAALQSYAYWKDGKECVGLYATSLKDAMEIANNASIKMLRAWGDIACAPEK